MASLIGLLSSSKIFLFFFAREIKQGQRERGRERRKKNKQKMQRSSVAYHFDPAFRGSKESQNNSPRTSFPFAMKKTVRLSHFFSFCLILNLFPPRAAVAYRQTKNAEAAFAEGIGDWSSGIIWAFCQTFLKGHGTV